MEKGSYSKLDQIEQIEIELNENLPAASSGGPSSVKRNCSTQRIDYVLVHEILRDTKELDDDTVEEIRKLAVWRNAFERYLEDKLGLVLQREVVEIEDVSYALLSFHNTLTSFSVTTDGQWNFVCVSRVVQCLLMIVYKKDELTKKTNKRRQTN